MHGFAGVLVALLIWLGTLLTWSALKQTEADNIARIAEAESFAARSRLVSAVEQQLGSLAELARHWESYGSLPRDEWASDARVELQHLRGVELIAWVDTARNLRFATGPADLALGRGPTEEQWRTAEQFVALADPAAGRIIRGPIRADQGEYTFLIQVPSGEHGLLVALVDAATLFEHLLRDQSPGYAISISWGSDQLYARSQPAPGLPEQWRLKGMIQLSLGPLWRVTHEPTAELVASLSGPALNWLLAAGFAIGALGGVLVLQNGRVRQRAAWAELAERQLAALNAHLEEQVETRTQELAERTADLETISESVSHDLRNPLNTISLSVHVLRREQSAHQQAALERITRAQAQMLQILDRLRSFSQVSYVTFRRQPIDMTALVREVADEFRNSEPLPQPQIEVGELPVCEGDPTLVRILLVNLIGNACKYSREREQRRIEVGADCSRGLITYFVRDNGMGFDPREAEMLFEPFARLGAGQPVEGTGVGLAVAARVVRRHGGRIWAVGAPNAGATFYFELAPRPSVARSEVAAIDESQFARKA
ncbi:MAG: sensor histidine kinase [Pseudomonadales bacterium]